MSTTVARPGDGTLLVVDDESLLRQLITAMLESSGYKVEAVDSAEAAATVLDTRAISMVLLDISLPGKSGVELLQSIVVEYPDTAVVMVTGIDELGTALFTLRAGAYDYLTKPFKEEELLACVARAMERRRLAQENRKYQADLERLVKERTTALERALNELNTTYDQTIRALGDALDLRDTETSDHCARVAAFAVRIAMECGMSDSEFLRDLKWGSYLHDIGKIGIPDSILLKPEALDLPEYRTIQDHPALGARMLAGIPFLSGASEVVRLHHERFDGTGYPEGLAGTAIPLMARVFAVADAVDAMTSRRPYREPVEWSQVRLELDEQSGTQFDPDVVRAYLRVTDAEWEAVAAAAPDELVDGGQVERPAV